MKISTKFRLFLGISGSFQLATLVLLILLQLAGSGFAREIPFSTTLTVAADFNGAKSVHPVDMDHDGDVDVLAVAKDASAISWFENTNSDGTAWTEHSVDASFPSVTSVFAADVDGDGDLDVLGAAYTYSDIAWWENTDGQGTAWTKHNVDDFFNGAEEVNGSDLDGDGDIDILGAASLANDIVWWENTAGNGTAWTEHAVDTSFSGAKSVSSRDIDGDGDLDIIGAAYYGDNISWFENTAGNGSAWTQHIVVTGFDGPYKAIAADIDGDGDPDVLGAAFLGDDISWWENTDGQGTAWTEHSIDLDVDGVIWVSAADVDSDGDLDVLGAGYVANTVSWWENTDGSGTNWIEDTLTSDLTQANSVMAADVDGDGDLDVLAAASEDDRVVWWEAETLHSSAVFPTEHSIDANFGGVISTWAADIDNDGDLDVLGAASNADDIAWWENTDGNGTAWTEHTVDASFDGAQSVCGSDLDGDGDVDVLGAAYDAGDIAWWENTDGYGESWTKHPVAAFFTGANSVSSGDIDGDGDIDILGTAYNADDITWWENTDGTGTTWTEHTVEANFNGASSVYSADVDGDGDADILGAAYHADDISWWENTAGTGTAWTQHSVDTDFNGAYSVTSADIDGDGDVDVVGAAYDAGEITWWENTDSNGITWAEHPVEMTFDGAYSVSSADMDGDGDFDILGAAYLGDHVTWWENTAGNGTAWTKHTVDPVFNGATRSLPADIDGDGDIDILGTAADANDCVWWENQGGQFALPTADSVVSATPTEGTDSMTVLQIDAAHRGRDGDGDLELVTFELLFEDAPGDFLDAVELDGLVNAVRIYHDNGDGVFETDGSDINFHTVGSPFSLISGVLTTTFVDGEADVQVTHGSDTTYFVAVDLAGGASSAVPNTMRVTHLTESSSGAEMTSTDIPLTLEFGPDTSSATVTVLGPEITVDPTNLQFGEQLVSDGATVSQNVTITNDGSSTLNISSISLVGDDAGEFNVTGDTGEAALAPEGTRTLTLTFDPNATGAKSADLRILSDDNDEATVDISLSGTGVVETWIFSDDFESGNTSAWSAVVP